MRAEIISIGDELLIGQVVNTNASWMAGQLSMAGIAVARITTIADTHEEIIYALDEASARSEIILITGGLGPTRDDITKDALCKYFGARLVVHESTLQDIEKRFASRGWEINDINRRQAEVPDSCTPIPNGHGTAPGMWFEKEGRIYVSMPGVPYEMKAMLSNHILPELSKKINGKQVVHKIVMTQGMGESSLAELIKGWENRLPAHMKLAYLPQPGIVRLRLNGSGPDRKKLNLEMDQKMLELDAILQDLIFAREDTTLEKVVGQLLLEKNVRLSTAESCTGGYIAHLITSIPGSSAYFTGSVVAYSNSIKTGILGVQEECLIKHGAVSEQTVIQMANGVKQKFGTEYAIAVSGVAGPDGGTDEKPVGTIWIAVAGPETTTANKYLFGNNRERNIRLAAVTALNKLRHMIIKD
jgi:nicotinamide-nucleotide amidase